MLKTIVKTLSKPASFLICVLVLLLFGVFYYGVDVYKKSLVRMENYNESLKFSETIIQKQKEELATSTLRIEELSKKLQAEQQKNGEIQDTISDIRSTVGTLEKLSKTDSQLLSKYSKVYFLNENYVPKSLAAIDSSYGFQDTKSYTFDSQALPFLTEMLTDAKSNSIPLKIVSAYRSFAEQKSLKSSYSIRYGNTSANSFSADQGYSEHQLGTTIDFSTREVGEKFIGFSKSPSYTWLIENAYRYGFILSYPAHNSYYVYEPWHWRFVGKKLALYLHDNEKNFYDLDQREINTYLVDLYTD
jgi:zinc D-Ala-D-Ala carboxypeptidase